MPAVRDSVPEVMPRPCEGTLPHDPDALGALAQRCLRAHQYILGEIADRIEAIKADPKVWAVYPDRMARAQARAEALHAAIRLLANVPFDADPAAVEAPRRLIATVLNRQSEL